MIPERLRSPTVGFIPTNPFALEGQVIEPFVSVPIANTARLAEAEAPDPALDPHGFLVISYGFLV